MTSDEIRDAILDAAKKGWEEGAASVPFPDTLIGLCITTAIKAEREACAKVCETEWSYHEEERAGKEFAAAIRERGQV